MVNQKPFESKETEPAPIWPGYRANLLDEWFRDYLNREYISDEKRKLRDGAEAAREFPAHYGVFRCGVAAGQFLGPGAHLVSDDDSATV